MRQGGSEAVAGVNGSWGKVLATLSSLLRRGQTAPLLSSALPRLMSMKASLIFIFHLLLCLSPSSSNFLLLFA